MPHWSTSANICALCFAHFVSWAARADPLLQRSLSLDEAQAITSRGPSPPCLEWRAVLLSVGPNSSHQTSRRPLTLNSYGLSMLVVHDYYAVTTQSARSPLTVGTRKFASRRRRTAATAPKLWALYIGLYTHRALYGGPYAFVLSMWSFIYVALYRLYICITGSMSSAQV